MKNNSEFVPRFSVKWDLENPPSIAHYSFEKIDYPAWKEYMAINWKFPLYASALYIVLIFSLQKYMKNRPALSLQLPLALWNGALGIFSMMGAYRISPELFKVLGSENGFHKSVCVREGLNMPLACWSVIFAVSKYVELGDTIFIVLRKRPLVFLQWFHHFTAMILAWQIIPYGEPLTRWLGSMNFGVHSIMYPYFCLKALNVHIPRNFSMMITTLQLTQMVVAVGLNIYSSYILATGGQCARETGSLIWVGVIYGSYMYLFAEFMYNSYFCRKAKKV